MSDDLDSAKASQREAALRARRLARAELPATYVDTWSSLIWKGHMRITLGEWIADNPTYRAAYLMELDDAKRFAEYILKRVKDQQERDATSAHSDPNPSGES